MAEKKKKAKQTVHKSTNVAIRKGLAKAAKHSTAEDHDDCDFC